MVALLKVPTGDFRNWDWIATWAQEVDAIFLKAREVDLDRKKSQDASRVQ